jgi:hypothetical protein
MANKINSREAKHKFILDSFRCVSKDNARAELTSFQTSNTPYLLQLTRKKCPTRLQNTPSVSSIDTAQITEKPQSNIQLCTRRKCINSACYVNNSLYQKRQHKTQPQSQASLVGWNVTQTPIDDVPADAQIRLPY